MPRMQANPLTHRPGGLRTLGLVEFFSPGGEPDQALRPRRRKNRRHGVPYRVRRRVRFSSRPRRAAPRRATPGRRGLTAGPRRENRSLFRDHPRASSGTRLTGRVAWKQARGGPPAPAVRERFSCCQIFSLPPVLPSLRNEVPGLRTWRASRASVSDWNAPGRNVHGRVHDAGRNMVAPRVVGAGRMPPGPVPAFKASFRPRRNLPRRSAAGRKR